MPRHYFNFLAVAALAATAMVPYVAPASGAASGTATLRVDPIRARPGDAILVTVPDVPSANSAGVSGTVSDVPSANSAGVSGTVSGTTSAAPSPPRRLRFFPTPAGAQAVAALPVDLEPGTVTIEVHLAGRTAPLLASIEIVDPAFPETKLSVAPKFIAPSPEQRKRMDEDQAAFREAFGRPFEPPLFAGPFGRPRDAATTGQFGERRTFNGKKQSQHYGTDLQGAVGEPILASNDGVVILVRDCFASGKSIALSHGGALFSVYFHLSEFDVRPGDRVRRGQPIGKVGMTGRATGPHLHFGVKVGDLYVDPESVYRLAFALASPPAP
jgi:hypothetical protein